MTSLATHLITLKRIFNFKVVNYKFSKKWTILGILFGVPILFILQFKEEIFPEFSVIHNYAPLDIINKNIIDLDSLNFLNNKSSNLNDNLTVLCFVGHKPMNNITGGLNLKQLVYDKFKGFKFNKKKFQIITIGIEGSEDQMKSFKRELLKYDKLEYWYFGTTSTDNYKTIYNSLFDNRNNLDSLYATNNVFIIDESRNQRGRIIDDENDNLKNKEDVGLFSYNTISVSEIKKKMNDDIRILFTEYRDRRKGNFNKEINILNN